MKLVKVLRVRAKIARIRVKVQKRKSKFSSDAVIVIMS